MATAEVELQNEDKSDSDKKTIFRYRRLYDMFLFISILLLFINYFTVQRELEELRKIRMIPATDKPRELEELVKNMISRPNGLRGTDRSQVEMGQPDPILRSDGNSTVIRENTLLTTLPFLGQEFEVSLDVLVSSFNVRNMEHGYHAEILRLTTTTNNCCYKGDRIVALFTRKDNTILTIANIGENFNHYNHHDLEVDKWIHVKARQFMDTETGKYTFEWNIDGSKESINQTKPLTYNNVKVWASSPKGDLPPANARIRGLKIDKIDVATSTLSSPPNSVDQGGWEDETNISNYIMKKVAGKISSGSIIQTFDELSAFYTLKTKVKVNRYTRNYASLWHFTTGPNCCGMGSRIPGIFIWPDPHNRFQISFQLDNDGDYFYQWNFELNTWYEIELSQTKEANNGIVNGRIKLFINGVEHLNLLNTAPRSFTGVTVYEGSPNSYTDGEGNLSTPDIDYEYLYYQNQNGYKK